MNEGVRWGLAVLFDCREKVFDGGTDCHDHAPDIFGHRLPAPPQHLPPRPQALERAAQVEGQHSEHQTHRLRHRQGLQGERV